jgi:hypothetical protein
MVEYRFFLIAPDGRIFQAIEAECEDDGAALAQARGRREPSDIEIWEGNRLVARAPARRDEDR